MSGSLELAASYTVLGYFLLPFIANFRKQHPQVSVLPVEQDRARIESGEVELAVALTSNLLEPKRFRSVVLARSRRQLWVAASNPLAQRSQVSLADAASWPYILPAVDEGDVGAMRYWRDAGLQPTGFIRTSSMEAVREMVALDLGVTVLSDMVFRPWSLEGRRIKAVPISDPIPTMEVGLIWRKGRRLSPVAEAFRRYLQVAVGPVPKTDRACQGVARQVRSGARPVRRRSEVRAPRLCIDAWRRHPSGRGVPVLPGPGGARAVAGPVRFDL